VSDDRTQQPACMHMSSPAQPSKTKPKRDGGSFSDEELENARLVRSSWKAERKVASLKAMDLWKRHGPPTRRELVPRTPLNISLFSRVAGLARISDENFERFQDVVTYEIDVEWINFKHSTEPWNPAELKAAPKQLRNLEEASAALWKMLTSMNDATIMYLRIGSGRDPIPTRDEYVESIKPFGEFAKQARRAVRFCESAYEETRREPGRPEGNVLTKRYRGNLAPYTLRLMWDVAAAGGRLTLDKNTREGTLIEALEQLRPYLPPDLIPTTLPVPTLSRLKSLAAKLATENQTP
jgi:hypothetical protein